MPLDDAIRARLGSLLTEGPELWRTDEMAIGLMPMTENALATYGEAFSARRANQMGWIAAALHLAEVILPLGNTYLSAIRSHASDSAPFQAVRNISAVLQRVAIDVRDGLLTTMQNDAAAVAIDDFLWHAEEYLDHDQAGIAGVVAGVAFEDALRRQRGTMAIEPPDISVENLIAEFERRNFLTKIEGRRARAAAAVRTSATHARWNEFTHNDVRACISFTREFVDKTLRGC